MDTSRAAEFLKRADKAFARAEAARDMQTRTIYLDIGKQWRELARQAIQLGVDNVTSAAHRVASR